MNNRTLEYRIDRLERAFLSFAALSAGLPANQGFTPEEIQEMQKQMAKDMQEMADDK